MFIRAREIDPEWRSADVIAEQTAHSVLYTYGYVLFKSSYLATSSAGTV